MLAYSSLDVTYTFAMPRRKVVEKDSIEMKFPQERWSLSKYNLFLNCSPQLSDHSERYCSYPSMLIVPVVVGVDLEHLLDKMSDLLIAFVQIWVMQVCEVQQTFFSSKFQ